MLDQLTNLLPPERERVLFRGYSMRIVIVVLMCVIALTLSAMLLLVPTYVLLEGSTTAKESELARIESTLSSADDAALLTRLTTLSKNADVLIALAAAPAMSTTLRALFALSRPGVTLSGITYTPATSKAPGTLGITGSAATRDALRNYQLTLQGAPFITTATLPVSAYAQDANIAFSIAITLLP